MDALLDNSDYGKRRQRKSVVSMQVEMTEKTFNDVGQSELESAKMARNKIEIKLGVSTG